MPVLREFVVSKTFDERPRHSAKPRRQGRLDQRGSLMFRLQQRSQAGQDTPRMGRRVAFRAVRALLRGTSAAAGSTHPRRSSGVYPSPRSTKAVNLPSQGPGARQGYRRRSVNHRPQLCLPHPATHPAGAGHSGGDPKNFVLIDSRECSSPGPV